MELKALVADSIANAGFIAKKFKAKNKGIVLSFFNISIQFEIGYKLLQMLNLPKNGLLNIYFSFIGKYFIVKSFCLS